MFRVRVAPDGEEEGVGRVAGEEGGKGVLRVGRADVDRVGEDESCGALLDGGDLGPGNDGRGFPACEGF